MKYIYFLLFLFLMTNAEAQTISVSSQMETIGDETLPAYRVFIPHADKKNVLKEWSSFLKDHKAKVRSSGDKINGTNALISSIYNDTLQITSKVEQDKEGANMFVSFSSHEITISPETHPAQSESITRMLHDFALPLSKEGLKDNVYSSEKEYNSKNKGKC